MFFVVTIWKLCKQKGVPGGTPFENLLSAQTSQSSQTRTIDPKKGVIPFLIISNQFLDHASDIIVIQFFDDQKRKTWNKIRNPIFFHQALQIFRRCCNKGKIPPICKGHAYIDVVIVRIDLI